ncbi:hypothetical protein V5O48_000179 [Marasmius crinis-equi]|uniref:Clathrin/coatomer adaptor adaptin-like N-terminal domain-containing protein n=1 Tax=Marasmius crinis-equi TaxID=585013 RepID=A0ABR3G242_9AGAR
MDVPFISSGASSRAHYVLVRKVEEETSLIRADQHLGDALDATLRDLSSSQLSLKQCKEHLIILLYCYTTASAGALERNALNNALSHAVTLAEAGRSVADKRIGYLFCSEIMPRGHALQLMLVNTLRKDLESTHVPRICLALDHLITSPSEDVIPAIQARLFDLLAHSSPLVRRRALLAYKELSNHQPELLISIVPNVERRIKDSNSSVSNAALSVARRTFALHESSRFDIRRNVDQLLASMHTGKGHEDQRRPSISDVEILRTFQTVGVSDSNLAVISSMIRSSAKRKKHVLLLEAFRLLCQLGPETPLLASGNLSPINYVRELLTSRTINDQYLFLLCLESVDPKFWAGTTQDIPSVLDQWEVEHVMRLLDSRDPLVRKMTVRVLNKVDDSVVASYYSQSLQQIPPDLSLAHKTEYVCRLLEILEIEAKGDGERYAREVQGIMNQVHTRTSEDKEVVLEGVVEEVLSFIRLVQKLPDFLQSILSFKRAPESQSLGRTPPRSPSQKSDHLPTAKLRYKAYETPPPATPRSKGRSLSRSSGHGSPRQSPVFNAGIKALTGGDLAIAASAENFEMSMINSRRPRLDLSPSGGETESESKKDLIALDSPFISDPRVKSDADIEQIWSSFDQSNNSRGWYEGPIAQVMEGIQGLSELKPKVVDASVPPFEGIIAIPRRSTKADLRAISGEVKIILCSGNQEPCAILRLKSSEEDSCLWRLRGKGPVYENVKNLLTHV